MLGELEKSRCVVMEAGRFFILSLCCLNFVGMRCDDKCELRLSPFQQHGDSDRGSATLVSGVTSGEKGGAMLLMISAW